MSWHGWSSGSAPITLALPGSSSGTSMMSMKLHPAETFE